MEVSNILTCPICLEVFFRPISLPCGHTICKSCLLALLQHKNLCPVCRNPTPIPSLRSLSENIVINELMAVAIPNYDEMCRERRLAEQPVSRSQARVWKGPIFKIPSDIVPFQPGRLIIFEPRYRQLYQTAMASDSMFCIEASGQQGEEGMLVRIPHPGFFHRDHIDCRIVGVARCVLLTNSRVVDGQEFVGFPLMEEVEVEVVEDSDCAVSEVQLPSDVRAKINQMKGALRLLEPYLLPAQRESLQYMYGDMHAALAGPWQQLSFWISSATRMTAHRHKELVRLRSAAERMNMLYQLFVECEVISVTSQSPASSTATTTTAATSASVSSSPAASGTASAAAAGSATAISMSSSSSAIRLSNASDVLTSSTDPPAPMLTAAQDQDQNPDQSQRQSQRSETALNNTSADIDNNESASAPAVAVAASEADSSSSSPNEDGVPPLRSADELRTLAVKLFAVGAIRSRIDMLVSFLPAVVILLAIYLSN